VAILARPDASGDLRLVAYVVARRDVRLSGAELRRFLGERLPEPMIPSTFVVLDALPLTTNGKVDRAALPAPGPARPDLEEGYVEPRNPVEQVLAAIWADVLGLERIGVHDGFFALGGDSIRSVRTVALARSQGLEFAVPDLFQYQTIARLAEHLGGIAGGVTAADEDEEELALLLDELESLSDDAAAARLKERAL
jgi:hypothetical protein